MLVVVVVVVVVVEEGQGSTKRLVRTLDSGRLKRKTGGRRGKWKKTEDTGEVEVVGIKHQSSYPVYALPDSLVISTTRLWPAQRSHYSSPRRPYNRRRLFLSLCVGTNEKGVDGDLAGGGEREQAICRDSWTVRINSSASVLIMKRPFPQPFRS